MLRHAPLHRLKQLLFHNGDSVGCFGRTRNPPVALAAELPPDLSFSFVHSSPPHVKVAASGATGADAALVAGLPGLRSAMAWFKPETKNRGVDNVPGPRAAHSCNLVGNKLYVFGGWNGKKGLNDLHVLDVDAMEWSCPAVSGTPPTTRNNHATFVVGTKLYLHGGHDGSKWLADLHVLDTEEENWSIPAVAGTPPSARACHTTTRLGRKLYMFGGYDGSKCFNDLDLLDLDTMTWIQPRVSGTLPQARNAQTVTVVGKRLFLFGGHSGNKHLRDLNVLDTETMTWTQPDVSGAPPPGLRGHTANLIGHKIFLFGGYDGRGRSNDLYLLDTETLTWEHPPQSEFTPGGRQRHTACVVGNKKLFVLGGFDGFKWLNDLHILDVGKLEENAITNKAVTSLLSNLRRLLNNPALFPDITFVVEGRPIYAHRALLAARSDHFYAMFTSGMKESREPEIVIPDWSYTAYLAMLEFLYTGSVYDLKADVALELMGLADHSALDGLKALCESTLVHNVDVENVCTLFSRAHRCSALDLKNYCLDYIFKNFETVQHTKAFDALGSEPTLLLEVTRETISRSKRP